MIYVILGTRAQLVKMAPIIKKIEQLNWPLRLVHTGQHKEGFDDLCRDFELKTDWNLLYQKKHEVKTISHALCWLTTLVTQIVFKPDKLLPDYRNEEKNIILVHGDTFSTVLGSLLGKRLHIKVGHVESGLRSFHWFNPFPEEINRLLTFLLADIAFCPGQWAVQNLRNYSRLEKIDTIHNTLLDSLRLALAQKTIADSYVIPTVKYGVVSIHRFENIFFDKKLKLIIEQLLNVAEMYHLIFVVHPATKKRLIKTDLLSKINDHPNIELRPRTGYFNFVRLLAASRFVITDGGSNQEELSYLNIPTFLMRKTTERQEGLMANVQLGQFSQNRLNTFIQGLNNCAEKPPFIPTHNPTQIICETIASLTN